MIVEKTKNKKCVICENYFKDLDFLSRNIEYLKSKHGEQFFHSDCFEKLLRKEKKSCRN